MPIVHHSPHVFDTEIVTRNSEISLHVHPVSCIWTDDGDGTTGVIFERSAATPPTLVGLYVAGFGLLDLAPGDARALAEQLTLAAEAVEGAGR